MELLIVIIVLALLFDFINGFHDAANSIATIVSTKVLTPFQAVLWAAFFNFVAFFIAKYIIGGFGIANTVSKTVVEEFITLPIILSGVIAAIAWNLITWWKGIPSSSSHTLIGGFAGAAIMASGFGAIQLNIILKIAAFIFLAPFIGMVVAFGFTIFRYLKSFQLTFTTFCLFSPSWGHKRYLQYFHWFNTVPIIPAFKQSLDSDHAAMLVSRYNLLPTEC